MKKDDVTLLIGAIAGYSVGRSIHKGFKMTGKVGPIQGLGRLATEVSVGVLTGSFVSLFADRLYVVGKRVWDEQLKRTKDKDDYGLKSGFISHDDFIKLEEEISDLSKLIDITIEDLLYFTDDQMLLSSNNQQCVWPDLIKVIEEELYSMTDNFESIENNDLYYFDAKQRICYDIQVIVGSGEEYLQNNTEKGNQNGGKQPENS